VCISQPWLSKEEIDKYEFFVVGIISYFFTFYPSPFTFLMEKQVWTQLNGHSAHRPTHKNKQKETEKVWEK